MTPNKDTLEKINEILANYEFQVIAMKDDDTGESQRAEARTALYMLMVGVQLDEAIDIRKNIEDLGTPVYFALQRIDGHIASLQALIDGDNQGKEQPS